MTRRHQHSVEASATTTNGGDAIVRAQAVEALKGLGVKAPDGVPPLARAFRDPNEEQVALLRDITGSPFRAPPMLARSCLTPAVVALAQAIYDQRAFERTRELAGALESARCTDAGLLGHLRAPGPHVRGCAAVDAVLGRG
jgi:hypothetical protein